MHCPRASEPAGLCGTACGLSAPLPPSHREQLLELLLAEILHPDSQAPSGVKSHFLDIFLEELTKVGANEVGPRARGGGAGRVIRLIRLKLPRLHS